MIRRISYRSGREGVKIHDFDQSIWEEGIAGALVAGRDLTVGEGEALAEGFFEAVDSGLSGVSEGIGSLKETGLSESFGITVGVGEAFGS